jgi:hypothetical protein
MYNAYVNGVTVWHIHGNKVPGKKIDQLASYQIKMEKLIEELG